MVALPNPHALAPLDRLTWQEVIFGSRLRRVELTDLVPTWPCRPVVVHVVRNEPFELVATVLPTFLAYAGLVAQLTYGPYDDSLTDPTDGLPERCDAVIVWLDMERYDEDLAPERLAEWVAERVSSVRKATEAPVLVADWAADHPRAIAYNSALAQHLEAVPGAHACAQGLLSADLGPGYRDARMATVSGSHMSGRAILETARQFGLVWLPAVLISPVKAIVVDLDHTLYRGVLSEDGAAGIEFSEDYLALQRELLSWQSRGVYLALASKNDASDVDALFAARTQLLVRPEHLSAVEIGWTSKADTLARIADTLHIGVDTMLFLDDNPVELAEVVARHPGVKVVQATSPALAAAVVRRYPGLWRFRVTATGARRAEDLAAGRLREEGLARAGGDTNYLGSLGMQLDLAVDPPDGVPRLAELSSRTNQFNTGLLRLNEAQAAIYVQSADRCAVTVSLRDRFSDSGVIGALFARRAAPGLVVDEIDVSCRALGRGLDELIVLESLVRALHVLAGPGTDPFAIDVQFTFRSGPRNLPARNCLEALVGAAVPNEGAVPYRLSAEILNSVRRSVPAEVNDVTAPGTTAPC
jgi:FkbH-like protein